MHMCTDEIDELEMKSFICLVAYLVGHLMDNIWITVHLISGNLQIWRQKQKINTNTQYLMIVHLHLNVKMFLPREESAAWGRLLTKAFIHSESARKN